MDENRLPDYDRSDNPTACCPRFHPDGWDRQTLHFRDKLFIRAETRSVFHVPINMGRVFATTHKAIANAGAMADRQFIVLSREISPWSAEHFFAVKHVVPGQQMVHLSGDYRTRVFEGPYGKVPEWMDDMDADMKAAGELPGNVYFFYTTCPRCAKAYGKNYVVAVAEVSGRPR